jgi:hypothetical protein
MNRTGAHLGQCFFTGQTQTSGCGSGRIIGILIIIVTMIGHAKSNPLPNIFLEFDISPLKGG